ncbi:MAG: CoB--CoM heterodisulfide reductase iron-sulfur subunit B family protein [Deltaproteobacteria bacterium]|nr:CoB--CoM heterodisulfide reductase iron-sulfur subunit B family protein [Deltaproteobacteria bacterium]MBW2072765.1 CoB--CoM heterodisulfide reductase iron-sulfur subunit B family protein [Deltaproteobacteria bacterium]
MKYAFQRCCTTPIFLKQYELSTNAVLEKLGVEIVDIKDMSCCGYPLRNYNFKAHVLSSARNLALAESRGLHLLTMCNCCYGTLKHVAHMLQENEKLQEEINELLAREQLTFQGSIQARHLLEVLYHDIGLETLKRSVVRTFQGLKIATHYGCHLLRPRHIIQFDNPFSPRKFDQLVELTGAESINWASKTDCCGSPVWGINDELSMDLTATKLSNAKKSGADYLCVACAYCQLQFDRVQQLLLARRTAACRLPSILYPQLLGMSLGIDEKVLGMHMNQLSIDMAEMLCARIGTAGSPGPCVHV